MGGGRTEGRQAMGTGKRIQRETVWRGKVKKGCVDTMWL